MSVEKSHDELRAALEAMLRVRAVESPPSAGGLRTVWHQGARPASLVTEIDSGNRVVRHEFSLFEEVLVWSRGEGFAASARSPADSKQMARAADALQSYQGPDRVLQHFRNLLAAAAWRAAPPNAERTQAEEDKQKPLPESMPVLPSRRWLWWLLLGLLVIALALVGLLK